MQEAVDAYFADCDANGEPYTVSGLAYHLGMTTQALRGYEEKDDFLSTVKRAKQRVEMGLERRLYESSPTGSIFNLKNNFGWKDAQDHNIGGQADNPLTLNFNGVPGGRG
jgi:hypothetical protein